MITRLLSRPSSPVEASSEGPRRYLSPSRLNCWLACPLKFRLRYLDGLASPTTPSLFVGKRVHAGLETYYRHRMLGITLKPGDVVARMNGGWEEAVAAEGMSFESSDQEALLRNQTAGLVEAYLAQAPADEPRPLGVEATLEAPLVDPSTGEDLGIPLLGIVDLVLDGPAGPVIVDFKTTSRSSPPLEVTHEVQLSAYAWLYRRLTGTREAGLEIRGLVKTKRPKIETHRYPPRSEGHFRRLFAVIREYLEAFETGRFHFRPGWGCAMCEFREAPCRNWTG